MTELPAGWAAARLEEVAGWSSGGTPKAGTSEYYGGLVPWAIIGDLNDGRVSTTGSTITEAGLANSSSKVVGPGTVLVAMYGSIGKLGIADVAMATNQAIACAVPNELVTREWLFWWLRFQRHELLAAGKGGTQANISQTVLKAWPIPLAPRSEQKRVVAAIEEAFSKLDAGETGLRTARQLLKRMRDAILAAAVTGRLVAQDPTDTPATKLLADLGAETRLGAPLPDGWEWAEVGALLTRIEAGKSFATLGRPAEADEVGVIKVSAMTWGEFRPDENKAVPSGSTIDPNWVIRAGDLLLSRANTSEYVGACVLVGQDHPNLILSDKSLRLVPEPGVSSSWLLHYLRSATARSQIEALATGTKQSMHNISQAKLRSILIALPPTDEQSRIVTEIERQISFLEACERAVDAGLARAAAMRRSVLKAAFEGQLVPQHPCDGPASVLLDRIRTERAATPKAARRSRRTA